MKLKNILFKKEEEKNLEAYELWEIRWTRRYGNYSESTEPVMEVFTNESDAIEFRNRLLDAFKLVKNTSENHVTINKK